jgi:hypothetical protein
MDVEIEHPHVHHAHGARHWADFAIPAAALFISLISISVAWHHGQVMRELVQQNERLVQANSVPWLQISGSNRVINGLQDLSFQVTNRGWALARFGRFKCWSMGGRSQICAKSWTAVAAARTSAGSELPPYLAG